MEIARKKWSFRANEKLSKDITVTVRGTLSLLQENTNKEDERPILQLSHGDPAAYPLFRTCLKAENAVVHALQSAQFNTYSSFIGILPARRAVAEYLSINLPYKISPDDVYMTLGCSQAMEVIITVLASSGANILLPKPGYPNHEARCSFSQLEVRHYDLIPDKGWDVDLDALERLVDENTVAILIINPGNPCGNVFSFEHLNKIAETARKLGILVISDEVYDTLTFGDNPFVPMATFGSIVPVITLGSISKKWAVPGWRVGWLVTCDPTGTLQKSGITECIKACLNIDCDPVTFVQVQLDLSLLEGIDDDVEFCFKLAKEESVIILPGVKVGMKNWVRVCFAVEPSVLEDGLQRIKSFCLRHAKSH
ncbi:nicotianamine aminotransferase 1-like isoform X2 [Mercurialis annua]|uniref:nicotianamine aminotransferase 1-like isoform X2 n=1 Tax=Mercurialis annua TaxID=3986 RepID=UPI00216031D6|nr:nicotianamine aminotransferase 1-like isoform X2 [Mercurialis annua]